MRTRLFYCLFLRLTVWRLPPHWNYRNCLSTRLKTWTIRYTRGLLRIQIFIFLHLGIYHQIRQPLYRDHLTSSLWGHRRVLFYALGLSRRQLHRTLQFSSCSLYYHRGNIYLTWRDFRCRTSLGCLCLLYLCPGFWCHLFRPTGGTSGTSMGLAFHYHSYQ